ncbi:MAG: PEGA domain-containing protein, partial [Polyangiaceae bacterium]|nr:PEGA domain-containing protein [Polyangiaceae bacterium]
AGYLRVVAHPWAHVSVDGQRVLTTPSARRIALRPGRHFLKFENPYYAPVQRVVRISEGETELVEATMVRDAASEDGVEGDPR